MCVESPSILCWQHLHPPLRKAQGRESGTFASRVNRSCAGRIATRPCEKCKDGAPAGVVVQAVERWAPPLLHCSLAGEPIIDFPGTGDTMGAPFFAQFAKGGSRERLRRESADLVPAVSPPALAKGARTGHPRFWLCRRSKVVDATPRVVETKSLASLRLLGPVRLRPRNKNGNCSSAIPQARTQGRASPDCGAYTSASLPACSS